MESYATGAGSNGDFLNREIKEHYDVKCGGVCGARGVR